MGQQRQQGFRRPGPGEHRRARENEANIATLRRFLDVLEVRYGRRAPIVAANPGAAVSMRDGTALPSSCAFAFYYVYRIERLSEKGG